MTNTLLTQIIKFEAGEKSMKSEHTENISLKYPDRIISNSELVLDGTHNITWFWDYNLNEIYFSDKWEYITGHEQLILSGTIKNVLSYIFKADRKLFLTEIRKLLNNNDMSFSCSFRIRLKSREYLWTLCNASLKRDAVGAIVAAGGSLEDSSQYKTLESNYRYLTNFDIVTGLPKFKYIFDKLICDKKTASVLTHKGAAYFIDLDNYRKVHDTYGLEVGNELLRLIVEKIKHYIRKKDAISQVDGDEFLLLLCDTDGEEAAKVVARRLLDIFKQAFYVFAYEIYITASIGVILTPGIYNDYYELVQKGNSAIHGAKSGGKNQYCFFEEVTNEKLIQRYNIENDLRKALSQNEFILFYQPVVIARTGKLKGLEALIRWFHPKKGIIPPLDFIPLAEETGLIVPIGNWVLETACRQNKLWQEKGYPNIFVAVNVSARQLKNDNFYNIVCETLKKTKLEAKYLELEITESAWMESIDTATQILIKLKEIGVRISLDDFGTHYSSLKYLKCFPIDKIKIDKSFIRDINNDFKNEAIISAIITLSQKMKIELVAEGVEQCNQLDYLREQGCELIQGYLYSKPLPSNRIEEVVKSSEIKIVGDYFDYYQI